MGKGGQSLSPMLFSKGLARVSWMASEVELLEWLGICVRVVSVFH